MAQGWAEMDESRLKVRVTPRATRDQIVGWREDTLRVRVTAPPVAGRANEALLRLLAAALGVPSGRLRLVRGQGSREKLIAVEGLAEAEARARLESALAGGKAGEGRRGG
jgi:uncharacterized protein (TIGR00251 family)